MFPAARRKFKSRLGGGGLLIIIFSGTQPLSSSRLATRDFSRKGLWTAAGDDWRGSRTLDLSDSPTLPAGLWTRSLSSSPLPLDYNHLLYKHHREGGQLIIYYHACFYGSGLPPDVLPGRGLFLGRQQGSESWGGRSMGLFSTRRPPRSRHLHTSSSPTALLPNNSHSTQPKKKQPFATGGGDSILSGDGGSTSSTYFQFDRLPFSLRPAAGRFARDPGLIHLESGLDRRRGKLNSTRQRGGSNTPSPLQPPHGHHTQLPPLTHPVADPPNRERREGSLVLRLATVGTSTSYDGRQLQPFF
ncbi:hypothetical protein CDD80_3702 [Ophiocordyceps camponoti-rufipedis]|uniref:Uncharacterized protein n=1 Tax=Ophiocordyceps camponoti-rufipedis TaxID=2004952 RepID=A0A2C5Z1E1_9HYPO|nr:hypothetical protein CDD80_3702 [Ophiocordyceps camponoti-rufipedis]